ncbi:Basal-body rod modification protein FlgD [compost metagenome]
MVTAVNGNTATNKINAGSGMLASNFETFLALLTTQLKNQDPLSPLDSNEFTAQLTQMAGVEQQLLSNQLLTALLNGQEGDGLANASNYIGKNATAVWDATKAADGKATWSYELGKDATEVELQVLNAAGQVVWKGPAPEAGAGVHDFTWNEGQDGSVYTLKVTAKDGAGKVDAQVLMRGRITGVEMYADEPYVTIGNSVMPLSSIIALDEKNASVNPPTPDPAPDPTPTPLPVFPETDA